MKRWHTLALLVAIVLSGSVALACSLAEEPQPGAVLGYRAYDSAAAIDPVPANVASAMPTSGEMFTSGGVTLWRHPADEPVMVWDTTIPRTGDPDTTAPSPPTITSARLVSSGSGGCGAYSCGRVTTYHFDIDATDDIARSERLTYAIYLTEDETVPVGTPDKLLVRDWDGQVWGYGNASDEGARIFAWVRVLDQAGNASELSGPVRVDTGESGCSAAPRAGGIFPVTLALLLLLRRRGSLQA